MGPDMPNVREDGVGDVLQDLRYVLRTIAKSPLSSCLIVLALALGIGANTAIFTVVNAVLLRPLPYQDPDRLVIVFENNHQLGVARAGASGPTYADWREQSRTLKDIALFEAGSGPMTGTGQPEQILGLRASVNLVPMLGVDMSLGRWFTPEEGRGGRQTLAVLSHGFWERRFGSDPGVIGKKIILDGYPHIVIGVLPPSFWFPVPVDGIVPWDIDELKRQHRPSHPYGIIGRLKPGISLEQASAEMNGIARQLGEKYIEVKGWGVTLVPMQKALFESIRSVLWVLLGAVGFVLLIACANVANLLLSRAATREKEVAVRMALGASRVRLVRLFLTESVLLGVVGGGLGLLLAWWGVQLLTMVLPNSIPIPDTPAESLLVKIGMDARVFAFTLFVSIATGVLFGLAPSVHASKTNVQEALKQEGRATVGSQGYRRVRDLLVIGEVCMAVVLLIGAVLMIETIWKLQQVDPGFQSHGILTMQIELPDDPLNPMTKYKEGWQRAAFFRQALERLEGLPGVQSAGLTLALPLNARTEKTTFEIEGNPTVAAGQSLLADANTVSPKYLQTMGIALKRGRYFTDRDAERAPLVVLIDETMARRYWPNEDPIGKRLLVHGAREIVGVVSAVKHAGLDKSPNPTIYFPYPQWPHPFVSLVVRTQADAALVMPLVKDAVWAIDKDQPVFEVRTMEQVVSHSKAAVRLTLTLLGIFAGVAVLLAALGVYGVLSYSVTRRVHEIGTRVALGARPTDVLVLVLRQGMTSAFAGIIAGLALAFTLTQFLNSLLYGVSSTDPTTFVGVSFLLALVALVACYIPARRAARVDPMVALRYE